jgi:predicted metal-dependent hydrolase
LEIIHIKQPRRRSYSLQFTEEGDLLVKTNKLFPQFMVKQVLEKHKDWIEKHRVRYEIRSELLIKREFLNGETLSILGVTYDLLVKETKLKNPKVAFNEHDITFLLPVGFNGSKAELLEKHLRKAAKDIFVARVVHFAKLYNLNFTNIAIKEQRSKWGSCSSKGNLNFNWKLIFTPKDILDYVVIHEICHLQEMNHSERFWKLVQQQCIDYKAKRKWLKTNGHAVHKALLYTVSYQ